MVEGLTDAGGFMTIADENGDVLGLQPSGDFSLLRESCFRIVEQSDNTFCGLCCAAFQIVAFVQLLAGTPERQGGGGFAMDPPDFLVAMGQIGRAHV